jgi:peptidoglycan/xylan/chitin deacetylase (PgdA/CDA1 family)
MTRIDRRKLLGRSVATLAGLTVGEFFHVQRGRLGANVASAEGAFDFSAGVAGCSQVALMFNVGSGYEPAYGILDVLSTYGVPGSMFVMGWLAEQNPGLVQQMAAGGHPVGSHGYLPPELTARSDDDIAADLLAASGALSWALGYEPGPWFTPYASSSDSRVRSVANSLGLVTVGWSVGSDDWSPDATADSIYNRVVGGAFDGAIIELHLDAQQSINGTAVALPWIIDDLSAQGYRFVTVPQIASGC